MIWVLSKRCRIISVYRRIEETFNIPPHVLLFLLLLIMLRGVVYFLRGAMLLACVILHVVLLSGILHSLDGALHRRRPSFCDLRCFEPPATGDSERLRYSADAASASDSAIAIEVNRHVEADTDGLDITSGLWLDHPQVSSLFNLSYFTFASSYRSYR